MLPGKPDQDYPALHGLRHQARRDWVIASRRTRLLQIGYLPLAPQSSQDPSTPSGESLSTLGRVALARAERAGYRNSIVRSSTVTRSMYLTLRVGPPLRHPACPVYPELRRACPVYPEPRREPRRERSRRERLFFRVLTIGRNCNSRAKSGAAGIPCRGEECSSKTFL